MCFIEVCDICYDDFLGGQNVWQKSYHAMNISTSRFGIFFKKSKHIPFDPLLNLFGTHLVTV